MGMHTITRTTCVIVIDLDIKDTWSDEMHRLLYQSISTHLFSLDRHFTDDILNAFFCNEKFCILIRNSLKFVPKGLIDNKSASVVMAWR